MDQLYHFPPQIHIESHFSVNLCHVFYLKAYLCHREPFRRTSGGSQVSSVFLGTIGSTCQYVLKCFLGKESFMHC